MALMAPRPLTRKHGCIVTEAEKLLVTELRRRGHTVETQKRIKTERSRFTVDAFVDNLLVVEVKGHYSITRERHFRWKTSELMNAGFHLVWVRNIDIYRKLAKVVQQVEDKLTQLRRAQARLRKVQGVGAA